MFTIQNGLSQGLVMCVMQDKEGFLWFSTKDGLNKYDGYRVTVYRNNPKDPYSLPDNFVTQLLEDSSGNFWVGTDTKGLFLFDKKSERFFNVTLKGEEATVAHEGVWRIQRQGDILLIGRTQHMYLYDISNCFHIKPTNVTSLKLREPILKLRWTQEVQKFAGYYALMPDNSLWMCNQDSLRVYRNIAGRYIQTESFSQTQIQTTNTEVEYTLHQLPNPYHKLIVDYGKLYIYDFTAQKRIFEHTIYSGYVGACEQTIRDKDNNYWLFSNSNVCYYFNTNTYQITPMYCQGMMQSINRAYTPCIDRDNRLWIGTTGHGVLTYDYRKYLFHPLKNLSDFYYSEFKKNEVLVRNTNGEPATYNLNTRIHTAILPRGLWKKKWQLWSLIDDSNGGYIMLIVDTKTKLKYLMSYKTSSQKLEIVRYPYLATYQFQNLLKDKEGQIWVKGYTKQRIPLIVKIKNANIFSLKEYYFPAIKENSEYPYISDWLQDSKGVFWFATLQGLYSLDEKKQEWKHFTHTSNNEYSLPPNFLFSICEDPKLPDKYLWIGSNGAGVSKFEKATGKCIHYTEQDGLPNNVVYGIRPDTLGNIWLSTNKGISCFNLAQYPLQEEEFINFTTDDGLLSDEFNRYEVLKLPNGNLIFGGPEGKIMFNPQQVLQTDPQPTIVITNLKIFNTTVSHKSDSTILSSNISYAHSITLNRLQSMFTISFAALNYVSQHKKVYKYILEGYDTKWIESGSKNEATYTNLSPGTYNFRVIGAVTGGKWNMTGASIQIIILPEWWQTWWFQSLVVLIACLGFYGVIRYRFYQKMKVYTLRNRIASDLHDEIGSTLSSVSLASSVLQKKIKNVTPEVQYLLNQINQNTTSMMEAMSDIVWAINTQNDSFENVVNRMRAFTTDILEPKNCNVHFEVESKIYSIALNMGQRKNLYLIFKEAINNMAKYAQCSNALINITAKEKRIIMTIKDDGIGFDIHKDTSSQRLSGNGLKNMKKRAAELNGKFTIHSEKIKGTEIVLEFSL
ncbi:MAG: hypothetical protein JST20_11655 [Bacteroidetes bacterium]|nr:hypothetical protein [Bacteroidota bacterium]